MFEEARRKVQDFLLRRKQSYRLTFKGIYGEQVLEDLAKFCRAHETTVSQDEKMMWVLEGRREVWLRIQHQLQLSEEELWKLYMRNQDGQ